MSFLVVGSGAIGKRHFNNLKVLGESAECLSFQADGLSGVEAALKRGVEGMFICTATQVRLPLAQLASKYKTPLYIEKPVAYRHSDLDQITDKLGTLGKQSFVGYMMRYHPAVQYLANLDLSTFYRFRFEIGHDVWQWRQNWNFADSYASDPDGGGVLLDLCHEIDMAQVILGDLNLMDVNCVDHPQFPKVDFSSQLNMSSANAHGTISMDYISPISTRCIKLWGQDQNIIFDLANDSYRIETGNGATELDLSIDRQKMFQNAMSDFISLVRTGNVNCEIAPIFEQEHASCDLICDAYERRNFTSTLKVLT